METRRRAPLGLRPSDHLGGAAPRRGPKPRVTIVTDYGRAERQLLDHLWERGARRPALLSLSVEIAVRDIMEDIYSAWCNEHRVCRESAGFNVPPTRIPSAPKHVACLKQQIPPDAILAAADGSALPVLDAARELGHHVGQDLLVASSIDSPAMRFVTPAITAIEAPPRQIGGDSARALLEVLHGDDVPKEICRALPTIARRESTTGLQGVAPSVR